jgi:hypothetical protein
MLAHDSYFLNVFSMGIFGLVAFLMIQRIKETYVNAKINGLNALK